jgi:hypothetical protein
VTDLAPGESASISFEIDDSRAEWQSTIVVGARSSFAPTPLEAHAFVVAY